jgi:hypothetical protein
MKINTISLDTILNNVRVNGICLEYTGMKHSGGYGSVKFNKGRFYAHRFFYMVYKGEIPKGYDIDHLCRNRLCVDLDHLEIVTRKENLRRGRGIGGKLHIPPTTCKDGHTLVIVDKKNGKRGCPVCIKIGLIRRNNGILILDIQCRNGHKRTLQNTGYSKNSMTGNMTRYCRDCVKIRLRNNYPQFAGGRPKGISNKIRNKA